MFGRLVWALPTTSQVTQANKESANCIKLLRNRILIHLATRQIDNRPTDSNGACKRQSRDVHAVNRKLFEQFATICVIRQRASWGRREDNEADVSRVATPRDVFCGRAKRCNWLAPKIVANRNLPKWILIERESSAVRNVVAVSIWRLENFRFSVEIESDLGQRCRAAAWSGAARWKVGLFATRRRSSRCLLEKIFLAINKLLGRFEWNKSVELLARALGIEIFPPIYAITLRKRASRWPWAHASDDLEQPSHW